MNEQSPQPVESIYGWAVVAGAFAANGVGFGILYSFTIFFNPILEEFGGGRGVTSVIASIAAALMLGSGAFIGRLADRFGPRRMIAAGSVLLFSGLILASISGEIWQVFLSYG
ncbi:MAG: MFS transporter, partial [Acidimicrobiia bacterium]